LGARVLKAVEAEDVRFVQMVFMDILGIPKNVAIPSTKLERAIDEGVVFDGSSIRGFKSIEESDMIVMPDPKTLANPKEMQKLARERAEISKLVEAYQVYRKVKEEIQESQGLLLESDEEMRELAKAELQTLKERLAGLEEELKILLLPKDPRDEKNVFLEIRAGTGGEEAALFAAALFRMYSRFAEASGWKLEILETSVSPIGGFKEIIVGIRGKNVFSWPSIS
jgi:peptide chain release factor 1